MANETLSLKPSLEGHHIDAPPKLRPLDYDSLIGTQSVLRLVRPLTGCGAVCHSWSSEEVGRTDQIFICGDVLTLDIAVPQDQTIPFPSIPCRKKFIQLSLNVLDHVYS